MPSDTATPIPDKLYFKIGEVARIACVKPHILRYWESEFPSFRPSKGHNKQRLYSRKDIDTVFRIKDLLYTQGLTIAGAKKKIRENFDDQQNDQLGLPLENLTEQNILAEIRADLKSLRDSINYPFK